MRSYLAELHVHTVLSPCACVEMIPPLIVQVALERGIQLIAITDHNASENAAAVIQAAKGTDLWVLPGMELQTIEEVHNLCLFDTVDQLQKLQQLVDQNLPFIKNDAAFFGEQFIVDHTGEFLAHKEQLLITSTRLSFEQAHKAVNNLGGLFIPAHVNRPAFGLLNNLGFVPPSLAIDALEISRHISPEKAIEKYPQIKGYPLIQSGDVHHLDDYLGVNQFMIEKPIIQELKMALQAQKGRQISILSHS